MHVAILLSLMLAKHGLPSHSLSGCAVCMQYLEVYHLVRWPTVESKPQQQDACHVEDHIVAGHRHRLAVGVKSALARAGHPGTCQTCHSAHHVHGTWRAHGNTIACCYQKDAKAQETAGSRPSAAVRPQACSYHQICPYEGQPPRHLPGLPPRPSCAQHLAIKTNPSSDSSQPTTGRGHCAMEVSRRSGII